MLNELIAIHQRTTAAIPAEFRRYLHEHINWNNRLIALIGARGTGKSTLVLQHYLDAYNDVEQCLYLSADHPVVLSTGIYDAVAEYFKFYGKCVIIDEVHKQPDWSRHIKALYDSFPDKKLIILGSSALEITHSKGDLARRMVLYRLKGLSFREYLNFSCSLQLNPVAFETMFQKNLALSQAIVRSTSTVLKEFRNYCAWGYYPFFIEHDRNEYYQMIENVIDKVIYEDIPSVRSLQSQSAVKLKRLLAYLAVSSIPVFSVSSLTNEIDVTRDTLYEYFDLLERATLVHVVKTRTKNVRSFRKSKILFTNPNLYYAISHAFWASDIERGNLRESFFASQLHHTADLNTSEQVDFLVTTAGQSYEIEVGGRNKDASQIAGLPNGLVFKDGIEYGAGREIPLYLAGFLY